MKNIHSTSGVTTLARGWKHFVNQKLLMLIVLLAGSITAFSQVTVNNTSTKAVIEPGYVVSLDHTTGTGTDRLLLVGISTRGEEPTGVTYAGSDMDMEIEEFDDGNAKVAIYSLVNPPTGTGNVIVSFADIPDQGAIVGAINFFGVHQTSPLGTAISSNTSSNNVVSASGDLIFDVVSQKNALTLLTPGSGQTDHWNLDSGDEAWGAASTKAGAAGTTTMSWTGTGSNWATAGVAIKPSGGSAPTIDNPNISSTATVTGLLAMVVPHTVGSDDNRLLMVGISHKAAVLNDVSYAGNSMDLVVENTDNGNAKMAIYSLVDPPSGGGDVIITFTTTNDKGFVIGVTDFYGVHPTTPLGTANSAEDKSTTPSVVISSASGELVFDVVTQKGASSLTPTTSTPIQTALWSLDSGSDTYGAGSTKAGATTVTMSWAGINEDWAIGGVSIKPILLADLEIAKTVNNDTPYIGETVVFTLTATNNSTTVNAPDVVVQDLLPSGYSYLSHSTIKGTYNGETGAWDVGTLNASASATLTINAIVKESGTYNNIATITGNVQDDTPGNDSASQTITICDAGGTKPLFNN